MPSITNTPRNNNSNSRILIHNNNSSSSSNSSHHSPLIMKKKKIVIIFLIICGCILLFNVWVLTRRQQQQQQEQPSSSSSPNSFLTNQQLINEIKETQSILRIESERRNQLQQELQTTSNNYQSLQSDYLLLKQKLATLHTASGAASSTTQQNKSSTSTTPTHQEREEEEEKKKNKKKKNPFKIEIKVLTYNRINSFKRCLESFKTAFYDPEDLVDLFIFIDHFSPPKEGAGAMTRAKHDEALQTNQKILQHAKDFHWPFGRKYIHYRQSNSHLQFQWIESWYPVDDDTYAFVAEDDIVVSPFWYQYMKKLLLKYRYGDEPRDPYMYGISFQRQALIPGLKHGIKRMMINSRSQPYLYQLIGTWGQLLFPETWRAFRKYYDDRRYIPEYKPTVQGLLTNVWYEKQGEKLWTPWIIRWALTKGMYNMYPNLGLYALSASYRDPGVNYGKTLGPDHRIVTPKNEPRFKQKFLDTGLQGVSQLLRFDYCFRNVPRGTVIDATTTTTIQKAGEEQQDLRALVVISDEKYLYNQLCTCEQVVSRSVEADCRKQIHFYVGANEQLAKDVANRGFIAVVNIGGTLAQYLKKLNANSPVLLMNQDNRVLWPNSNFTALVMDHVLSGVSVDASTIFLNEPGLLANVSSYDESLNSLTTIANQLKPVFPASIDWSAFQKMVQKDEDLVIKTHDYGCAFVTCQR